MELEKQQLEDENDVKLEREAEERARKIDLEFQTYNMDQKIEILYTRLQDVQYYLRKLQTQNEQFYKVN
jgi:hypothetical protein